jgi:biopolymer transport protein ExbB
MDSSEAAKQAAIEALKSGPQDLNGYIEYIKAVWVDGGWVMIPLFLLTVLIYFEAVGLTIRLNRTGVRKVRSEVWGEWLRNPLKGVGHVGEVIRYVTAEGMIHDKLMSRIAAVRLNLIPAVNQRILMLGVLVTVAPLMGLLGTVIGMLTTFKGLGSAAGQTVDMVAEGISVALITTQTGLMIAIPGYIFIGQVIKKRNEYNGFLTQLEVQAVQICAKHKNSDSAGA